MRERTTYMAEYRARRPPPAPLAYELEVARQVDPVGALAFDEARRRGFLVVGNDVGDVRDPRIGFVPDRAMEDNHLFYEYRRWCSRNRRPLVWVSVVMTRSCQTVGGEVMGTDPAALVHLELGGGPGLDDEGLRRIEALPGVNQYRGDAPRHCVLLLVHLADAPAAAEGLFEIAQGYYSAPEPGPATVAAVEVTGDDGDLADPVVSPPER